MQSFNDVPNWERDDEVAQCRKCHIFFDWLIWKHHCRACGRIFCDTCCCHYIHISDQDRCPAMPSDMLFTNLARCCGDCSTTISARQDAARFRDNLSASTPSPAARNRTEVRNIPTIDAIEYNATLPEKVYIVQLPVDEQIRSGNIVQVQLDGAVHHIVLPMPYISPGDILYVRANDPQSLPQASVSPESFRSNIVTEVLVFDVSQADLHTSQPHANFSSIDQQSTAEAEVPYDAFIKCQVCTYHNFLHAERCAACEAQLLE